MVPEFPSAPAGPIKEGWGVELCKSVLILAEGLISEWSPFQRSMEWMLDKPLRWARLLLIRCPFDALDNTTHHPPDHWRNRGEGQLPRRGRSWVQTRLASVGEAAIQAPCVIWASVSHT